MPLLADRVKETTTTTGTGALTLGGAASGFQTFSTAFGNGVSVYYVIAGGSEWEIGVGTTGAGTLSRDTVLQSTNADALVPFSAGTKDVFCAYVADRAVTTLDAATLTNKTIDSFTNFVGANQVHLKAKATENLAKGDVCKVVGWNAGENAIEVAKIANPGEIAIGATDAVINIGDIGTVVNTGQIEGLNTNSFTIGTILYPNTSGGFTSSKPSSGQYQAIGFVLRQQAINGVVYVEFTNPQYVEASTNTADTVVLRDGSGNFSAGTITAALSGNASTASTLQTARNINGVSFNGSADITVTAAAGTLTGATLASGVTASSLTSVGTLSSLTVSGDITIDTTTLKVDSTNNRVGIGIASPSTTLDVVGDVRLANVTSGNKVVYIGTTSPAANNGTSLEFQGSNSQKNWAIRTNWNYGGTIEFCPSTTAGGMTYTTPTVTFDGNGNAGIGMLPGTWGSTIRAVQINTIGALWANATGLFLSNNVINTGSANNYISTAAASRYYQLTGRHVWEVAASGTGGTAVTLTEAMSIDNSGNLGIGTSSPATKLDVNGTANIAGTLTMADNVISRPRFTDYAETYTTPAISAGALTLNIENGNVFRVSRNANITTLTISNPSGTGNACSFTLIFDANGTSYTITWPAAVKWPGGTAPTITTTNSRSDMFVFYTNNAGTTWYAVTVAQNFVTS